MTFKPCAVVPSRNHHLAVDRVVRCLRQSGLPVFVIDDSSAEPARSVLAALHAPGEGVTVRRFAENQGKGGAVIAGFELAVAAGFSHVLQVDADAQHDLSVLPQFLAAGVAEPQSVIVGVPIFDATMPAGRRAGRWLTHLSVCVETLSPRILDAMCGFRLYPLASTMAVVREERVGHRMDFDPEILVRLMWRGVRPVTIPVRVVYPADNISNFRLVRDNWAITKMHTRLILTMLMRLPRILAARRHADRAPRHWSRLGERGAYRGIALLAGLYRVFGWYGCMAVALPVALYFHVTGFEQRRASRQFLRRAFARRGDARSPGAGDSLRHSLGFARKVVDTFAAWVGGIDESLIEIADPGALARAMAERRGLVLVVSHLGNVELSRATLDRGRLSRLTVLVHTRHAQNYARLVQRFRPESAFNVVQVTDMDPATIGVLHDRVEQGGWIAIAGDRTPVTTDDRVSRAGFLGHDAPFPQGPYVLAHLLDCPLYLLFCLRENGRYRIYFERFADRVDLPRSRRQAALADCAARYAARLEAYCLKDPFQWYNFFDFWAPPARRGKARTP